MTAAASARLFSRAPDIDSLEKMATAEISELIFPVGFYKTKAVHLQQTAGILKDTYGGEIPDTIEELVKLPGVGRKTANLVLAVAFDKPAICVDTHVQSDHEHLGLREDQDAAGNGNGFAKKAA